MYIITWITPTLGVKRESFASLAQASKRLRFLQTHNVSATLDSDAVGPFASSDEALADARAGMAWEPDTDGGSQ